MKFFKTRIGVILITLIVCMALFGGVTYGAGVFDKDIPTTMVLKASTPDLALFADSGCTIPITIIDWGEVNTGEEKAIMIWVKNTGNKNYISISVTSNLDPALGTVTCDSFGTLDKGIAKSTYLRLNTVALAEDNIPTGVVTTFSGSY